MSSFRAPYMHNAVCHCFFSGEDLPVPRVVPSQTASYGDNIRLHCNLTHKGNPSTTPITQLTYLKDGRPVKITNDVEDPLIFTDVRAEDGGNYTCRLLVLLYRQMPYNVTGAAAASLRGKNKVSTPCRHM